eukprot:1160911-Pelagomonas_calceolata.AAC.14
MKTEVNLTLKTGADSDPAGTRVFVKSYSSELGMLPIKPTHFFFSFFSLLTSRLRSRHGTPQRSSVANHMRKPQQLNANQRHVHLIEVKYCEDTRPGQQLEAAQQQHTDLGKLCNELNSLVQKN